VDDGTNSSQIKKGFKFETAWLTNMEFRKRLIEKWPKRGKENVHDFWKRMKELRQLSKGMGANLDGEMKRKKSSLLLEMERLDRKADQHGLEGEEWKLRYKLERELEEILNYEENVWQKRSSKKWILQGDANTGFFHSVANGRRKCTIFSLETEEGDISDVKDLSKHVEEYYKNLFGREERGSIRLQENLWEGGGCLTEEEAMSLIKPFTEAEIKAGLDDMKINSTPGPDGLPSNF
jgi:hypothetical protein